ncbi:hypothetical protein [Azospirillum sp. TSO22-1]|uniref:hypothetical protein n=1 Tax=Azospirillum sp. TSO22-1 TaxID=716789 RepID=UPI000D60765E|nr:hypothetical protein [Azospirillum sp. TSO22-1]PWC56998.1 hypothetical protein TSO221_00585 [Azospirillum sp. TSO22-1]
MMRKSQIALSTVALAAVLVAGLGMVGGATPPPAQATVAERPAPVLAPAPPADDGRLSATGMEHVPVFK